LAPASGSALITCDEISRIVDKDVGSVGRVSDFLLVFVLRVGSWLGLALEFAETRGLSDLPQ
jgi:hypothetical protein